MTKSLALNVAAGFLAALTGCAPQGETPDDQAMQFEKERAIAENRPARTPQEVGRDFYPKQIDNYFEGMDSIAVNPNTTVGPESPTYSLEVPVSQLIDVAAGDEGDAESAAPKFKVHDPITLPSEILGRNTWMIWSGGNERFWDWLTGYGGLNDFLILLDSRKRSSRFREAGLINEPGMLPATAPGPFGLWLDVPANAEQRTLQEKYIEYAFDSKRKYPGEESYQYGKTGKNQYDYADKGNTPYGNPYEADVPPPYIYGLSSGIVGLRLFPNPNFDKKAREAWDPERFYEDESYYTNPKLVRPYRVGMSCAFCHASYHPLKPPLDPDYPEWENISGNIGAQYLRIRAVFGNLAKEDNFIYHVVDSQPPGTIDTSLIPSDNVNNTNAMNPVFNLPQRVLLSLQNPKETLSASSLSQPSVWGNPEEARSAAYQAKDAWGQPYLPAYQPEDDKVPEDYWKLFTNLGLIEEIKTSNQNPRRVPRILFDGSDSIGGWGALARVYLNIGTYSEQWNRIHTPLVGFTPQMSFTIDDCETHSAYWHAIQDRVGPLRDYFLKVSPPMQLLATSGGDARIVNGAEAKQKAADEGKKYSPPTPEKRAQQIDISKLEKGREVFAKNCIICHSSIQPETFHVEPFDGESSAGAKKRQEARAKFLLGEGADDYLKNFSKLGEKRHKMIQGWADQGEFWYHNPGQWLADPTYQKWAQEVVELEPFWRFNFLSIDYRVPINLIGSNSARAVATNAINGNNGKGNMWGDFASASYQSMPSPGGIEYFDPYSTKPGGIEMYTPRHRTAPNVPAGGGGPGFYRPPTLVSVWSTAPLLHNNSLGRYIPNEIIDRFRSEEAATEPPPSEPFTVEGRLEMFDDAIRKLLWPEKRLASSSYNEATAERLEKDNGLIWRTPVETYLELSAQKVPDILGGVPLVMKFRNAVVSWLPWIKDLEYLWAPSLFLIIIAYLLLRLNRKQATIVLGILSALTVLFGIVPSVFPGFISGAANVRHLWTPAAGLVIVSFLVLILPRQKIVRILVIAVIALIVAGIALTLSGGLPESLTVSWEIWTTAAVLVLLALLLLWLSRVGYLRYLGYTYLGLAVVSGLLLYFFNGKLGGLTIGPIPAGTPVNLLVNANPAAEPSEIISAVKTTVKSLAEVNSGHLSNEVALEKLRTEVAPALQKISKSPDFVMDKGHYYPWFDSMSDEDKDALIELLKTF